MMRSSFICSTILIIFTLLVTACAEEDERAAELEEEVTEYDIFWAYMREYCGLAFEGEITDIPEGADLFTGDERLIVHFRECEDDLMRLPFHAEDSDGSWDRSRTWVLFRHGDNLELRHDHRHEDGTEEEATWYGGTTFGEPDEHTMEFLSEERSEEVGVDVGWRITIEPGERYVYGTIREGEWQWRLEFDLSQPVEEPPAPWGH